MILDELLQHHNLQKLITITNIAMCINFFSLSHTQAKMKYSLYTCILIATGAVEKPTIFCDTDLSQVGNRKPGIHDIQ